MPTDSDDGQVGQDLVPEKTTVVGIGASAGGLAALKTFFENVPADTGLTFVVVVHLSPEHKSLLADLLQPHVRFNVQQVTESTALERNAEFDGMPQSAIASGMVDMILPVAEIPQSILRFNETRPRVPAVGGPEPEGRQHDPLPKVLGILRARTDRDFSRYKRATILRRIARRMQLNYLEDFDSYLGRIREHPEEAKALADDLLITVTSFFRDPEVFERLSKQVLPEIFDQKAAGDSIRVWSVGCATGEEAYSLAMLLVEEAGRRDSQTRIQVFASDLHRHSLEKAREGFYPGDIETDVNSERLRRFFVKENGGFRIRKELRELVVFAPHNLLGDPPFSRLDLISCRNLLIYLEREVQRDVIELFHYSLCPGGHLVLGSAEVVDASELFRMDDKKLCLYRRRNVPPPEPRLPVFPMTRDRRTVGQRPEHPAEPLLYGVLHERLVERYAPPSILVSAEDKVVHLSEHAGRYLVHPGGELTASVVKLVREELRIELRSLLQTARETHRALDSKPIPVQFNGHARPVLMHIRPSLEEDALVLIIFEEREPEPEQTQTEAGVLAAAGPAQRRIIELEEELINSRQRLQATIEEFESSQEEMKASNEEMQSTNEELRSTLEELETSKEELQSINEELQTVNQENRHKVEELSQLSSDLHNLLAATDIATLFLDRELRILRFTPKLGELFNIRQTDRGRPISDLTSRIGYSEMCADAATVLGRLVTVEREVRDEAGRWYLTRVLPYRSTEDRIEGVVVTFVEITSRRIAEAAARDSEQRLAAELDAMRRLHSVVSRLIVTPDLTTAMHDVLESAVEITGADMGYIQLHNRSSEMLEIAAQRGFSPEYLKQFATVSVAADSAPGRALRSTKRVVIADITRASLNGVEQSAAAVAGYRAVQSTPLVSRNGRVFGVLSTHYAEPHTPSERDLRLLDLYAQQATDYIDRHHAEEEISRNVSQRQYSEQKFQELFNSMDEGFCIAEILFDKHGKAYDYRFLNTNPAFSKNMGLSGATGKTMRELAPGHEPMWVDTYARILHTGIPERFEGKSESLGRYFDVYAFRTGERSEHRMAILFRDVTERNAAQERQRLLVSELNHRVKNTLTTVQSIANQTMITASNMSDFVEKFRGRLATLAEAHDQLANANWVAADLTSILRKLLAVDGDTDRIALSGPLVWLLPQAALGLSLVIYELATNARKYGALSRPEGRLAVHWSVADQNGESRLNLDWRERKGPPVTVPVKPGFGTVLIEQNLKGVGGESVLEFHREGVICRIQMPLRPGSSPGMDPKNNAHPGN